MNPWEAESVVNRLPRDLRRPLKNLHDDAGSGTESVVRAFFESRHVKVRSQVEIPTVGRVDLVVGESWIIECDSGAHHSSPQDMENDRRRDLAAQLLGYTVTRLTWQQVFLEPDETWAFLAEMLARGHHRKPPCRRAAPRQR